jgi:threonine aldolase
VQVFLSDPEEEHAMIDLKSDLMSLPTEEMWEAMRKVKPGGWVIDREDPEVRSLEKMGADMMGKEDALFVMTGRMACLVALMTHCERGHQVILEKDAHILWSQEWGLAYICGLFPRVVEGRRGVMDPKEVDAAIREYRFNHLPVTDLVCIENTHNMAGGTVVSVKQTEDLCEVAHQKGVQVFIDGARIFHAAIALGVKPKELAAPADSVMFSLIKGLGAPGGVLLCGKSEFIRKAHGNLGKIGANAFHRAGILAAAGIVALEKMVDQLRDHQRRAKVFAKGLSQIRGVEVDLESVQTNIVMADISGSGLSSDEFLSRLLKKGVRGHRFTPKMVRFTFHRLITDGDVQMATKVVEAVMKGE